MGVLKERRIEEKCFTYPDYLDRNRIAKALDVIFEHADSEGNVGEWNYELCRRYCYKRPSDSTMWYRNRKLLQTKESK